jgi:cell fate (sporulation/competence/biofilm development) regulator YmcA (YheA/YmcA/DUF963 family)
MINYLANCRHDFFCDYFLLDRKFAFNNEQVTKRQEEIKILQKMIATLKKHNKKLTAG